jgi:hypothetical protein
MDLELASTDELVFELLKRHDHGLIVGMRIVSGQPDGNGNSTILRRWKGNSHCCAGLAHDITMDILGDCKSRQRVIDEETPPQGGVGEI